MNWIETQTSYNGSTCIKFVPRKSESTYLSIISDVGCYSYVDCFHYKFSIKNFQINDN